ncbi:tryptophan halogenase family protein [Marinimicrobium sp. ABcell2]|uniref:tryptophan halogenase family protein n=1 Tax=Marinimicrobium sp. ABcell2 TaxID=3069751 RepID=UPI0027B377E2|nr:tryptophan halogenase family protein [Marinimicrobium sp. ABcell2]MDQ2075879.1 tryptophan 7-halogenase [Marinimicrobium sp. ABcell2]
MESSQKINRIVIAGGGTAGWMAAAAISKLMGKHLTVTLVESDEIATVGVGEATIPTLHIFHRLLGIRESEFMAATNATFKLGISFENWRDVDKNYIHSFGFLGQDCWAAQFHHFWVKGLRKGFSEDIGEYCKEHLACRQGRFAVAPNQELNHAYHLDATRYAAYLRKLAEAFNVKRVEGKITRVNLHEDTGFITSLNLEDGQLIEGDLFIDCTGFRALLIEKALHTGYDDWSHWLPMNRAVAMQTTSQDEEHVPYTRAIAHDSGWQWRIPLQTRTGNGLVYCDRYMSDDEAIATLQKNVLGEPINQPRVIRFLTGTRRKHWNKNCVALGLSSGFIEPLESTSIHLIQRGIIKLLQLFPSESIVQANVDEFNSQTRVEMENIRDFIVAHYHVTDRKDAPFWRHCRSMTIPDSLRHRLELVTQSGQFFKKDEELFNTASWFQVLLGQGLLPQQYHPIVDFMSDDELKQFLENIKSSTQSAVAKWPNHMDFIRSYCQTDDMPMKAKAT